MDLTKILPYFNSIGTFLTIMKNSDKIRGGIKDFFIEHERDVNEIFDEIIQEKRNIGDFISLEGYLLKYGQVFKPYTNANSIWTPGTEKDLIEIKNKNGELPNKNTMDFLYENKSMYMPVQCINPFNNIGCAFIYDPRFSGFALNRNISLDKCVELPVADDKYSRPMLVLYDTAKHSQYINKKVCLKGKLCEVPKNIAESLNGIFDDNIREICSNFYRPFNENVNMICLSLLDENSKISFSSKSLLYENFEELNLPIFVEAKIDNLNGLKDKEATDIISKIIPNSLNRKLPINKKLPTLLRSEYDETFSILTTDEIQVVYRNPGTIGFYMVTSLINKEKYEDSLNALTRYINNFSIDYKNLSKKNFGKEENLDINFLFDYNKKSLFNSKYIEFGFNSKSEDINTDEIFKWLNKKII